MFGVLSAAQVYVQDTTAGHSASWRSVFNIVYFYWAWALVTPLVLRAAQSIEVRARWEALLAHLPAAMVAVALQSLLYAIFQSIDAGATTGIVATASLMFVRHFGGNVLTYVVIVVAFAAWSYYHRSQQQLVHAAETALRASELEAALTRVRLDALTAQLRPHFLFNTLNMVSTLVAKQDAIAANRVIARLGDLLRATLSTDGSAEVTLDRELELTRAYLEIAQLRFGPRLTVVEQIDDTMLGVAVPPFILQPLVENAVLHGVAERSGQSRIDIVARRDGESLVLEVRDDGPGFDVAAVPNDSGVGLGLSNVRERLTHHFGNSARLDVGNATDGGACVVVQLPLAR